VAVGIAGVSQPLAAADRYVRRSTGVDVGACTSSASPCQTIQYADDQSSCGDVIHIHGDGGTPYDEAVIVSNSCTAGNELTFRAWAVTGTPVISSSGGDGMDISGAFIIIDGLRFDSNVGKGIRSGVGVNNLTVQNSEFVNNSGRAIESAGGGADDDWVIQNNSFNNNGDSAIVFTGNNVTIDGNTISGTQANQGIEVTGAASGTFTITDNVVSGGLDGFSAGIEIQSTAGTSCLISGNRAHANAGPGIFSRQPACIIKNNLAYNNGANGIGVEGNNVVVENNTVYNNTDSGLILNGAYTGVIIENNILASNGLFGISDMNDTNEPAESFNLFFANVSGPCQNLDAPKCTDGVNGDIVGFDPLFVNAAADDFHLSQIAAGQGLDSPAVDAGSDTAINLGLDTFTTRTDEVPDSGTVDMGYHYSLAAGPMQVLSGWYPGDGLDNRPIFVGFKPDVVVIKSDTNTEWAVIRTSTMAGDATKDLTTASVPLFAGGIKSLDPTGFTVGTDPRVNGSGSTIHWIAFKVGAGEMKVGTYTGNGNDNTSVTGVGFRPDYVITLPAGADMPVHRSSAMIGDTSYDFDMTELGPPANAIQAFEPDGFQVGNSSLVNADGNLYHYIAWKATANRIAVW
jgi:hypothetical protein